MIDAIGRRRRARARDAEAAALAAERGWRLDLEAQTHESATTGASPPTCSARG